jgi:hypothetical protein
MIDVDNLPDYVLNSILKNLGWEPGVNDDQLGKLTARVSKMSVEEAFGCYCVWNGLLGSWGATLLKTIDEDERADHRNFRSNEWLTKDNRRIQIGRLKDSHLLAAYRRTGDESLFKEMVVRLFEQRIAETKKEQGNETN